MAFDARHGGIARADIVLRLTALSLQTPWRFDDDVRTDILFQGQGVPRDAMWNQGEAWRGDRPFGSDVVPTRSAADDRLGGASMILALRSTVSALTYSLIREECAEDDPAVGFFHNAVARFVVEERERMPALLRLPIVLLTLAFDARAILTSGRPFHRLPHEQRWPQIERWRESRFGACTNFIRFHRGLVLYGWYAMLEERDREG